SGLFSCALAGASGVCALSLHDALPIFFWLVTRQSWYDESRQADAIVVFGAAEYAGHPSPIYRARLDHAYTLFRSGFAPLIITSRSDEHTSELQSLRHLVCRHLLDKKNN